MRGSRAREALGGMATTLVVLAGCAYDGGHAAGPAELAAREALPVVRPSLAQSDDRPIWKIALEQGIEAYDKGNFREASRLLRDAAEHPGTPAASRVEALKYHAFALCSSNLRQLCRQQFERALAIDPSFDLLPAERGHPIWGPEFQRAKSTRAGRTAGAADLAQRSR